MKLRKKSIYLLVLMLANSTIFAHLAPIAKQGEYVVINHMPHHDVGMFSVLSYVAGILYHYDQTAYAGLKIDFAEHGLYYSKQYGPNWWQYYFEKVESPYTRGAQIKQFSCRAYRDYAYFTLLQLNRHQVHSIIEKYFVIKGHIKHKIEEFIHKNFNNHYVIGVHYRGTDKYIEAPRVAYGKVVKSVQNYIRDNHLDNYRIYVATDEQQFADHMSSVFGKHIIFYDALRSKNDVALHMSNREPYRHGQEALIECVLLSQADVLLKTKSNLSMWSTYFNPHIPVIELDP